jgi:hypothetical protein
LSRGVPVVRASSPTPARKSPNGAKKGDSPKPTTDATQTEDSPNGKKRSRGDDAGDDQSEAKKAKADE